MWWENIQFSSSWMEKELNLHTKPMIEKFFSVGALKAAKWVYDKKPGLYTMLDMIS